MLRSSRSIALVLIGSVIAIKACMVMQDEVAGTQPATQSSGGRGYSHFSFGSFFGGGHSYSSPSSGHSGGTAFGGFGSSAGGHATGS